MTIYAIFASAKGGKDLIFATPNINEAKENSKRWHEFNQQVNYKVYESFLDGTFILGKPIIINDEIIIGKGAH